MTRWLIVNADDFGLGRGINRGIVEAHLHGIVTSASLMVTTPWSEHAAVMAGEVPGLGVGLHADLGRGAGPEWNATRCTVELRRQLQLLRAMTGRRPTHLDSHHNRHRDTHTIANCDEYSDGDSDANAAATVIQQLPSRSE